MAMNGERARETTFAIFGGALLFDEWPDKFLTTKTTEEA